MSEVLNNRFVRSILTRACWREGGWKYLGLVFWLLFEEDKIVRG